MRRSKMVVGVVGACVLVILLWVGSYAAMRMFAHGGVISMGGHANIDYRAVGPCARGMLWVHEPLIRLEAWWRDVNVNCQVEDGRVIMYGRLRTRG
jgi:hypothetical protein